MPRTDPLIAPRGPPGSEPGPLRFGPYRLSPATRALTRDGAPVPLGARAFDILVQLAAKAGQIVTRPELNAAVWHGAHVEENNLTVHISSLRRVLGASPDGRSLIQTVPGRGYMLATEGGDPPPASPAPSAAPSPGRAGAPSPGNAFIGRTRDKAAVIALLADHALVTITALGGMGKTRLAQEIAAARAETYADGVHVAELASIEPAELDDAQLLALVAEHLAALFPLGNAQGRATERLTGYLRTRRLLLVLDNCEHVVGPVARLAHAILGQCPNVSILATSREALGVPGEYVFRLPPLSLPPPIGPAIPAAQAATYDAVRLFLARAAASAPGFVFDDAAAPAVVEICTRLDGIALAIEMVVPQLRILTIGQIAERLHASQRLLTAPARHAVPRHRTLRAMIDWSYSLLDEGGRRLLRCLSVFASAVDLEAVLAVATDPPAPGAPIAPGAELEVLEQLTGLVDKSIVVAETTSSPARYRLLETVRQYARDRLAESDEGTPADSPANLLRRRHATHYAGMFETAFETWPTTPSAEWLPTPAAAVEELRAALGWCFGPDGDPALGLHLAGASTLLWWELPNLPLREARRWFQMAVDRIAPDTPPRVAARVWFGYSWPDMRHDDRENLAAAERAAELFRQAGDRVGLAAALWRVGSTSLIAQPAKTARDLAESEHLLRQGPPGKWLALCLVRRGDLLARAGQNAAGLAAYAEALAIAESMGHWYGLTNCGSNMADLLFVDGQPGRALDQMRRLRGELPLGPRTPLTCTLCAHLMIAGFEHETLDAIAEVLDMAPNIGFGGALARTMETLALLRIHAGDTTGAARLAGYARRVMSPAVRWGAPRAIFQQMDAALTREIGAGDLAALLAQGAAWDEATAAQAARAALEAQRSPPQG